MAENTTIARPYAQAIFAIASESGELQGWSEVLSMAAQVASNEAMAAAIDNPDLTHGQVADIFIDVCGAGLNDTGKNMVRILAENDRLSLLPEIAQQFEVERASAEGTVQASVISAVNLSAAQKKEIATSLTKRLGREVSLECTTDESLLGGAIIRAGDVVIDGSVRTKLEKLGHQLMR